MPLSLICIRRYTPREERVDIHSLLRTTRSEEERFPVSVDPFKCPEFCLDPQLLRYIHRNAISNACKYGSPGGIVETVIKYDRPSSMLTVDIINEPGEHHERLVQLGETAAQEVFLPGRRLHSNYGMQSTDSREVSVSSGDGAWIMRKCARMLTGDVSITFNPERTIFNLSMPVTVCVEDLDDDMDSTDPNWETPPGT
jgi:signal transduction histidine kinase